MHYHQMRTPCIILCVSYLTCIIVVGHSSPPALKGQVDDLCGTGQGSNALHFSGADNRYAQTVPLDVRYGAVVKFLLTFGPKMNDPVYSDCKPALSGNVM